MMISSSSTTFASFRKFDVIRQSYLVRESRSTSSIVVPVKPLIAIKVAMRIFVAAVAKFVAVLP